MKLTTTLIAIILGFIAGAIILNLTGISSLEAYKEMILGAVSKPNYISTIIVRSTPLILTGLSVAFAFKTGLFNIGAEGQFIIGSLAAAFFGLKFNLPWFIQIPVVMLLAALISGLYGGISGYLKARFGVHEVLSTIMFNWIALYFSNWALMSPIMHRPHTETSEFIQDQTSITILENWKISEDGMKFFMENPMLGQFFRSPVNFGIFIAILACILAWYILEKTTFGYELKAVGFNANASKYGGIKVEKRLTQSMFIAGALAGLAGATQVMGVSKNVAILAGPEGYGFEGIAVALIGLTHPIGTIISGFFLGTLKYTGQKLQSSMEVPSEVITLMIGAIVFFLALEPVMNKIISSLSKKFSKGAN